jgi:enoyl-[acyl-carrier protein] reductase II
MGWTMNDDGSLTSHAQLKRLWDRGASFLGTDYAILGGAMSWLSDRHLVSAISNAGGFGVIACGSLSPSELDVEIAATYELTDRPFGVNLITMHPDLGQLIATCGKRGVSHVALAGGLPPASAISQLKDAGIRVLAFAPALALAKRLVRSGVDALVIEGMEAGGHIGPVSTGVLAQEILPAIQDIPVFVAGGIGHGDAIAMYLAAGASGVQMGTRFVCATECIAHPRFKQAFLRGHARDAVPSTQLDERFPVIPVRALGNKGTQLFVEKQREVIAKVDAGAMSQAEAQLAIERFWAGALRRAAIEGDVEFGSVMAGQSVGLVTKEEPVAEIIEHLVDEAAAALHKVAIRSAGPAPFGQAATLR